MNNCNCDGQYMPDEETRYKQHVLLELPECSERQRRISEGLSTHVCIDPCITQEIKALWSMGVVTTGCCCGHKVYEAFVNVVPESEPLMQQLGYELIGYDKNRTDMFKLKHQTNGD